MDEWRSRRRESEGGEALNECIAISHNSVVKLGCVLNGHVERETGKAFLLQKQHRRGDWGLIPSPHSAKMEDILNLNVDFSDKKQTLLFTVAVQVTIITPFLTLSFSLFTHTHTHTHARTHTHHPEHTCLYACMYGLTFSTLRVHLSLLLRSRSRQQALLCIPFSICAFLVASTANAGKTLPFPFPR